MHLVSELDVHVLNDINHSIRSLMYFLLFFIFSGPLKVSRRMPTYMP